MRWLITGGRRRKPRHLGMLLLTLPILVGGLGLHAGADSIPLVDAPPLPAQPGIAAAPCQPAAQRAGAWRELTAASAPQVVAADPWQPCMLYRAADAQTLDRSTDEGRTWTTVFHDAASSLPVADPTCVLGGGCRVARRFAAGALAVPARGGAVLAEDGIGDGVVASADAGRTWALRNGGLEGRGVHRVVFAPGNPSTAYASMDVAGGVVGTSYALAVTNDGGASWAIRPLTMPVKGGQGAGVDPITTLAIDPQAPEHLWMVWPTVPDSREVTQAQANAQPEQDLFESSNGGTTWLQAGVLPPASDVVQLVYLHSPRHWQRLVAVGAFSAPLATEVVVSDDDGGVWRPTGIPRASASDASGYTTVDGAVALDPRQPEHIVYVGGGRSLRVFSSADAFDTVAPLPRPAVAPAFLEDTQSPLTDTVAADGVRLDLFGHLDVAVTTSSSASSYWRLTLPPAPRPVPPPALAPVQQAPPTATAQRPFTPCNLPAGQGGALTVDSQGNASALQSGSVAYDGHELLYTLASEHGPLAYHGVLHAIDPVTCVPLPDIVVAFDPADDPAYGSLNGGGTLRDTFIDDLTYDPRRNVVWANVGGRSNSGLFAITVTGVAGSSRGAVARLVLQTGCGWLLSYDASDDTLWTCDTAGNPAHLRATDGSVVPSCVSTMSSLSGASSWLAVAPGRLYVEQEDDTTVFEYDSRTCQLLGAGAHRTVSEPLAEDEQLACDPLSFGPDSAVLLPSVAMWIRDAQLGTMGSYAIDNGWCPLGTVTRYLGVTSVAAGASLQLCATLVQVYPGGARSLDGMPLRLTVSGSGATAALSVRTAPHGTAGCTTWAASVAPGAYRVTVTFDPAAVSRSAQYLPSSDAVTVQVVGPPAPALPLLGCEPVALSRAAALLPPLSPPQPPAQAPAAQAQIQSQAQAQMQAQAQTQTQSVAQAQPGVMVQRSRQVQAAHVTVTLPGHTQSAFAASRSRLAVAGGLLGAAVAGMALVGRGALVYCTLPVRPTRRRRP